MSNLLSLNPQEILSQINLRPNMVVVEFGAGSGGFTIPLARRLKDGLVYAIDIQETPLTVLKSKYLQERIMNIRAIRSDLEQARGSTLADFSVDIVFIINVLFQIDKKNAIISEARRILKTEGTLVIVDWNQDAPQGPVQGRVSKEQAKKLLEDQGFKKEKEFNVGPYHFGLVFRKP